MATKSAKLITLSLPAELYESLVLAARDRGWTAESLAIDCISQNLEMALRHRVLIDRLGIVDQALIDLAAFVGEATAVPSGSGEGGFDLGSICRYHPAPSTK